MKIRILAVTLAVVSIALFASWPLIVRKNMGTGRSETGFRSLEELMPEMEARQTTGGAWRVWSKAYNASDWTECEIDVLSRVEAEAVIGYVQMQMRIKYEVAKALHDALKQ